MLSVVSSPFSSAENSPQKSPQKSDTPGLSIGFRRIELVDDHRQLPRPDGDGERLERRRLNFDGPDDQLHRQKDKLRRLSSTLLPLTGDHANDVYVIDSPRQALRGSAIFKPGELETKKAILCRSVAEMLGLSELVPQTIKAHANALLSKQDIDITYKSGLSDGRLCLVNPADCYFVNSLCEKELTLEDGAEFSKSSANGAILLTPKNKEAEDHPLLGEQVGIIRLDGEEHAVASRDAYLIEFDETGPYIIRDGARFEVESSGQDEEAMSDVENKDVQDNYSDEDSQGGSCRLDEGDEEDGAIEPKIPYNITLVRRNVSGLLQDMVEDAVTEIGGKRILTTRESPETIQFFSKIRLTSFINAVVLAILFRTEDGKASDLKDANFLFTKVEDEFNLTLIDLDETWPESNDYKEGTKIARLRLGLMGYPQATKPLEGDSQKQLETLLQKIQYSEELILGEINSHDFENVDKITSAFKDVLERLKSFSCANKTLRDLVFHVFPIYKEQWTTLEDNGKGAQEIADNLGYGTVEEIVASRKKVKTEV